MDAVILYVNGDDDMFQKDYMYWKKQISPDPNSVQPNRIRDWNTLQYLLRSIDVYAPFIEKVHLVVYSESQVPKYIDREKVHVVFQHEIIPEKYNPVFNSRAIEYFLHNIEGLSEEFVYFNDDMIFFDKIKPEDLFVNGKPCYILKEHLIEDRAQMMDLYYIPYLENARMAFKLSNKECDRWFELNHGCCPLLKSWCKKVYDLLESEMDGHINRFRANEDWYHSLYINYMYLNDMTHPYDCPTRYYIFKDGVDKIYGEITHPKKIKQICINDVWLTEDYQVSRRKINDALNMIFPRKSRFEKCNVALCVIVKNENKYITEFIEHYFKLGVKHIFIYDNNDEDGENVIDVVKHKDVSIMLLKGRTNCQDIAYNHCYKNIDHNKYDWVIFVDCDEFIHIERGKKIDDFLIDDKFKKADAVHLHWKCVGDNGKVNYSNKPLKQRFPLPCRNIHSSAGRLAFLENDHVKPIIRTGLKDVFFKNQEPPVYIHSAFGLKKICDSEGNICPNLSRHSYNWSGGYILHYITKSTEEYCQKIKRGYPDQGPLSITHQETLLRKYFLFNYPTNEKVKIVKEYFPWFNLINKQNKN